MTAKSMHLKIFLYSPPNKMHYWLQGVWVQGVCSWVDLVVEHLEFWESLFKVLDSLSWPLSFFTPQLFQSTPFSWDTCLLFLPSPHPTHATKWKRCVTEPVPTSLLPRLSTRWEGMVKKVTWPARTWGGRDMPLCSCDFGKECLSLPYRKLALLWCCCGDQLEGRWRLHLLCQT